MRHSEWAGEYLAHLATAHVQANQAEPACAAVIEAAAIARATSSDSLIRMLRAVHSRMIHTWSGDPRVTELADTLR
jgi:hypothetical protein